MSKLLIINADDYGLTPGCDRAIREALDTGAVTSVSVLVWDQPLRFPEDTYDNVRVHAGLHLRLTDGAPVLPAAEVPSLVGPDGNFRNSQQAVADNPPDLDELRAEWRAQIRLFLACGATPTHLDTHRHTHALPGVSKVYEELCDALHVAGVGLSQAQVRRLRDRRVSCADYAEIRWVDGNARTLTRLLDEDFRKYSTVHLMTHPGYDDAELRARSTMNAVRQRELGVLMDPALRETLQSWGVEVVGMRALDAQPDPLEMVDILYLAWNRVEYTIASLAALKACTDWSRVRNLWLFDDGSTDGAREFLCRAAGDLSARSANTRIVQTRLSSPVASMNQFLQQCSPSPWFVKLDNDVVVSPGWLEDGIDVLRRSPEVDLLGLEPVNTPAHGLRHAERTGHIGGVGFMRTSIFEELPVAAGRMGFSDWQVKHPQYIKAWLNPSMPVILLDRLPFEPWLSLGKTYQERGWQRPWKLYDEEKDAKIWEWWRK